MERRVTTLVALVLEATRRVIGLNLTCIAFGFLLFGYFGPYMPDILVHKGYSIERMATTLSLTTEGIFGLPTGVAATFVFFNKSNSACKLFSSKQI